MKTYQHIIFWIVVYGSLTLLFGKWFEDYVESFYYVSLLLPVVMATSYFFNYFLVPRYLFRRKFFLFGLYSVYMLVVSLCLELLASVVSMLLIIKFGDNRTGPLVTDVFSLAIILYFIVLFTSFILLIKHYFVDQGAITRLEEQQSKMEKGFISVLSRRKTTRIDFDKLLYIESLADYINIHRENGGEVVSKEKISHMENRLPDGFLRIHRSFIVNVSKITSFSREELFVGETKLPVSRTYRSEVISRLQKL
ncbi:MAG: LytTR family transcriptional regulator DNA-binding domain-containing protein [Bacteroidota bacterium]